MKLTTALRHTRAGDVITAAGTNPKWKFYNGTEAFSPAGTLLATLTVTGALGVDTNGTNAVNETFAQSNASHVTGTPTFALITTSADVAVGTIAIPADMTFSGTITNGVDITANAGWTFTESNA